MANISCTGVRQLYIWLPPTISSTGLRFRTRTASSLSSSSRATDISTAILQNAVLLQSSQRTASSSSTTARMMAAATDAWTIRALPMPQVRCFSILTNLRKLSVDSTTLSSARWRLLRKAVSTRTAQYSLKVSSTRMASGISTTDAPTPR